MQLVFMVRPQDINGPTGASTESFHLVAAAEACSLVQLKHLLGPGKLAVYNPGKILSILSLFQPRILISYRVLMNN